MKMLDIYDEYTGEVVNAVPYYNGEELHDCVERAYAAQPGWEKIPLFERGRVLYRLMELVDEHREELAMWMAKEMGKPISSGKVEVAYSADIGRGIIERAKHLYGEVLTDTSEGYENNVLFTRREALGVVIGVIPFNYPCELAIQKIAPALIMGNTIILKAPTSNPTVILRLVELAHEAGIPKDVIQYALGSREDCTEHLLKNPKVACLALTGSCEAGTEIIKCSADTMKRVILELGGNDALIIREDCANDPEQMMVAIESVIGGRIVENSGQVCASPKRILVHRSAADKFVKGVIAAMDKIKRGSAMDPDTEICRLVSVKAAERVAAQLQTAVDQGARIVYGGTHQGAVFEPTVLVDVTRDMDIAKDTEVFGPVVNVIVFDTDEEALEIANASKYGLSSAVITKDMFKAFWFAENIEASACVVNGASALRHNDQPFGGCKHTGFSNEGAGYSPEEYSRLKCYDFCNVSPKAPLLEAKGDSLADNKSRMGGWLAAAADAIN